MQDRDIVTKELVYPLSIGAISGDLEWPKLLQTTQFSTFCFAFYIFIVSEVRDFKFGR